MLVVVVVLLLLLQLLHLLHILLITVAVVVVVVVVVIVVVVVVVVMVVVVVVVDVNLAIVLLFLEPCSRQQVWSKCSRCIKTCTVKRCGSICIQRCECPRHRPIQHKGMCIRRTQCPGRCK